jgi:serine/threonine protein kinase
VTTSPDRVVGDPFAGTTLDARYRLDTLIGRGGMASVYRGEDLALGRQVAVKVFAEAAEGIDDTDRRRSETALLASLAIGRSCGSTTHPAILRPGASTS